MFLGSSEMHVLNLEDQLISFYPWLTELTAALLILDAKLSDCSLLSQVVDETDRLLREAYQSWLPTVLQLAQSSNYSCSPFRDAINPPAFGSLKTVRSL